MRILFVCTGNTCRSPMAEHIAKAKLKARGLPWSVRSVGLSAVSGIQMAFYAEDALKRRGIVAKHGSRPIDDQSVAGADLILTMTIAHSEEIARRYPQAADKTEALLRFISDGNHDSHGAPDTPSGSSASGSAGPAVAQAQDGQFDRRYDILDPIGGSAETYEDCANRLDTAIERLLDQLEAQQEIDRLQPPGPGNPTSGA